MIAPILIILTVFFGLSMLVIVVVGAVMLATGQITVPGSMDAKLRAAEIEREIAIKRKEIEFINEQADLIVHRRHQLALNKGDTTDGH